MPKSVEETMDYMGMLDKLAEEYPELEKTASKLTGELEEMMPMDGEEDIGMEPGEEELPLEEEGEFAPIPTDLEDEELEEEEEELSL